MLEEMKYKIATIVNSEKLLYIIKELSQFDIDESDLSVLKDLAQNDQDQVLYYPNRCSGYLFTVSNLTYYINKYSAKEATGSIVCLDYKEFLIVLCNIFNRNYFVGRNLTYQTPEVLLSDIAKYAISDDNTPSEPVKTEADPIYTKCDTELIKDPTEEQELCSEFAKLLLDDGMTIMQAISAIGTGSCSGCAYEAVENGISRCSLSRRSSSPCEQHKIKASKIIISNLQKQINEYKQNKLELDTTTQN